MENNFNYGQPVGAFGMPGQPVAMKKVEVTSPMSHEDYEKLKNLHKGKAFTLELTDTEELLARCPHRYENGAIALKPVDAANGVYRCEVCGKTFNMARVPIEELGKALETINTVLNQVKTIGVSLDKSIYNDYMLIGPMLHKLPELYTIARKNWLEFASTVRPVAQASNPRGNSFDVMNSIMNNTYSTRFGGGVPTYNAGVNVFTPGYGYQVQQPVMPQAPMGYQQPNGFTPEQLAQAAAFLQQQQSAKQQPVNPAAQAQAAAGSVAAQQPFAANAAPTYSQPVNK